jgi:hypothetical protein
LIFVEKERIYGVITPVAEFEECMAWSYKMIRECYLPETYVVLFPGEKFGMVKCTDECLNLGFENVGSEYLDLHLNALKEACGGFKVLVLAVPESGDYLKYAEQIVSLKRDVVVVICCEFTAYDKKFSYQQFENEEAIESQDMMLVKHILDLNSSEYLKYVAKNGVAISGKGSLVLGLEMLKLLGVQNGELLNYCRKSGVGYGSMVFTA